MRQGARYVLTHSICLLRKRDLYPIEFTAGKYIDFAIRQKYRIAKQYIDKQEG